MKLTPLLDLQRLQGILEQPTAPFREQLVALHLQKLLDAAQVPHFQDPVGNIIVGADSLKGYRSLLRSAKPNNPLRFFIAHMDHPGFHGVRWVENFSERTPTLEIQWHGGTPTQHLEGAPLWLSDPQGNLWEGELSQPVLKPSGKTLDRSLFKLTSQGPNLNPVEGPACSTSQLFGAFRFRRFQWQEGELLFTKAADDLVGAYAIVETAIRLKKKRLPFLGLLSRAEEVGFIGAIGHFELGWLNSKKDSVLCVSLETSRQLPGAETGKGPIVRLGDRSTVFHSGSLKVFSSLAQKILPDQHQRRIMDGGSCEATAATAYGFNAIGISVPLGNYHNQNLEGGPDSIGPAGALGPAPEFVHLSDVEGLLQLCQGLLKPGIDWNHPWETQLKDFQKSFKNSKRLLRNWKGAL